CAIHLYSATFTPLAHNFTHHFPSHRNWNTSNIFNYSCQCSICMQNSKCLKTRKHTDTNCDAEADLQGLVSNILDEADSQDNFYSESLPTCNPIWSPKTLKEELLQYFQPEPKTFNNPSFIPNHLPHEAFSKTQQPVDKEVNELSQLSSGLAGNQQWSFNSPNGGSYSIRPQKLPPGLPLSNKVAADLSQQ
uniref:Uncharacterized protein n=1 Tax=Poecilia formosa TaxID=48698 RepID=A0A096M1N7_POEFO